LLVYAVPRTETKGVPDMYGRLTLITADPGERSKMEALADRSVSRYRQLKGFKGVTFFTDEQEGVYGSLTLWESREDAEAAAAVAGPELLKALDGVALRGQPQIRTVEIYEPGG
jgi:quinol monooxygenase YgiN